MPSPHHGQADSPEIRLTTALSVRIYFANSITQARSSGCFRCVALPAKLDLYSTVHFGEHNKTPLRTCLLGPVRDVRRPGGSKGSKIMRR